MGVKFISVALRATFDALLMKDKNTLYWISETSQLYKGDQLFGTGALATEQAAGLLSAEDYAKLRAIAGLDQLTAVDGTLNIVDTANGGKAIGIAIASDAGNALRAVDGGLFVPTVVVPEYSIEKVATEDGFSASYKLKKTVGEDSAYVGDTINIAKDLVLQSATLEIATEDGIPYAEARVGDPYIKMVFNNAEASNLYVPVKGLVDTYTAGSGINIVDSKISVKLAANTHGLVAVDGALALNLATRKTDGAMSAQDKLVVDSIPHAYVARKYDISDTPVGTLVNYGENEIRIMVPEDAEFAKQNVGTGGDANTYYITLKTFAPENAVGYKERLGNQSDAEVLTDLKTDEFGRRYQPTWLGVATYSATTDAWNYYGKGSSESRYIGWDYRIDWFDDKGVTISTDNIRINLSNELCHHINKPYYMANYATSDEVQDLKEDMENTFSWSEM